MHTALSPLRTRRSAAALAAALFVVTGAAAAGAQTPTSAPGTAPAPASTPTDTPSVGVAPTESRPEDPNSGQWFVFQLSPGESKDTKARVANPADVPQLVRFYIRDLTFGSDGTPTVSDKANQADVGSWARFPVPELTVPAKSTVLVDFGVTVPANAEPGDHVGVFVAENVPLGGDIKVIRRVATRLYVTVPGDATKAFRIIKVARQLDSTWFPSKLAVEVTLRNTGRVRVTPTVKAKSTILKGSRVLLARSVEPYSADVDIPWYGGPVKVPVEVVTEDGLRRSARTTLFVIPWGLIISLILAGVVLKVASKLLSRRAGRMRRLQSDLQRLEKIVTQRPTGRAAASNSTAGVTGSDDDDDHTEQRRQGLLAGVKRARRTGSQTTLEVLALELNDEGGGALDVLLEALEKPSAENRQALVTAAAAYGADEVTGQARFASLPDDVVEELMATIRAARKGRRTPRT